MPPWPHLTDDLPAPRDDEPSSLRQDIADELADHLNCAFTRELHLARDEEKAKEKTLDRFGDPRRIARKLWLDAMQEKLMSQRMTFVLSSVVGLTCVATLVLVAMMLRESQAVNAAIVDKLTLLATTRQDVATSTQTPLEWQSVRVKLVLDEPGHPPAVNFKFSLEGTLLSDKQGMETETTTDDNGFADFGLIRIGQYEWWIRTPWNELSRGHLLVTPGSPKELRIVCPARPPAAGSVQCAMDWPDDLRKTFAVPLNIWTVLEFWSDRRVIAGNDWRNGMAVSPRILISPKGYHYALTDAVGEFEILSKQGQPLMPRLSADKSLALFDSCSLRFNVENEVKRSDEFTMSEVPHRLGRILFIRGPLPTEADGSDFEPRPYNAEVLLGFQGIAACEPDDFTPIRSDDDSFYRAQAGAVSDWKIKLPGTLVKALRRNASITEVRR